MIAAGAATMMMLAQVGVSCTLSITGTGRAAFITAASCSWMTASNGQGPGVVSLVRDQTLQVSQAAGTGLSPLDYSVSLIAGTGNCCSSGDGGPATSARLSFPRALAKDRAGNLYIADLASGRVRKVDVNGVISTYAGGGSSTAEGVLAINSAIVLDGLAIDGTGNLYISNPFTNQIRVVSGDGLVRTFAGTGSPGYSGDGGPATMAWFSNPHALAVDGAGNLYVADSDNNRIRKIGLDGIVSTVAGNGSAGISGDGGLATRLL